MLYIYKYSWRGRERERERDEILKFKNELLLGWNKIVNEKVKKISI